MDHAAVLAETTLTNEHRCWEAAKRCAMLGEMALAKERHRSLSRVQAAETALAMARVVVLADSALPKPALAKDKRHQEEAAAEQCQADDGHFMAPVMPPDPVDTAIRRIWENCSLCAAPLKAILAEIERNNIAHEA